MTVTLDATPVRRARIIVNTDAKNEADDQNDDMTYRHPGYNRPVRVYDTVDARFHRHACAGGTALKQHVQ